MVRVYAVNIKDAVIDREWLKYVSEEKKQRLSRMRHPQSLAHSLIGDLLVRYLIMQYLGVSNQDLHFATNQYGKPYLVDPPKSFHFNLSHSGHWVVCAVGPVPVGIDVQLMEPIDIAFAQEVMTPQAYEHYLSLPPSEQLDYFYNLWTRQESFLKLAGKGMKEIPLLGEANSLMMNSVFHYWYKLESGYSLTACAADNQFEPFLNHLNAIAITSSFTTSDIN